MRPWGHLSTPSLSHGRHFPFFSSTSQPMPCRPQKSLKLNYIYIDKDFLAVHFFPHAICIHFFHMQLSIHTVHTFLC